MDKDTKYFKIPIPLLNDLPNSTIQDVLRNAVRFTLYEHSLQLEQGTIKKRYQQSASFYNVNVASQSFDVAQSLYNRIAASSPPFAYITTDKLWQFVNEFKTPHEIACLCGFIAVKSILQRQDAALITSDFLLSRMSGFPNNVSRDQHNDFVKAFHTRWKLDKLKHELEQKWYVKMYGQGTRGFYVSIKLELAELIEMVEKQKAENNSKRKKSSKKALLNSVKTGMRNHELTSTIPAPYQHHNSTIPTPSPAPYQHHDQHL